MTARGSRSTWLLLLLSAPLLAVLALPVLALALANPPAALLDGLASPVVRDALLLSVLTTATSIVLVVATGTPLAWALGRSLPPGSRLGRWLTAVVELPIVIPPAVVGVALLAAFGRRGLFGPALESAGLGVSFTVAAVILAQTVVAAPFYVQSAAAAFRALDPELLAVARTLGARPSRVLARVAVPLALPGLLNGAALAWARALGEFGATLLFAGSLPGRTQTLPLAIYATLESDVAAAQAIAVLLVLVAFALLWLLRGPLATRARSLGHG